MTNYFVRDVHVIVHPKTNGDMDQYKSFVEAPRKENISWRRLGICAVYPKSGTAIRAPVVCLLRKAATSKGIMNVCRLYARQPGLIYIESSKKVDFVGVP